MPEICNQTGSDILGGTGNITHKHPKIWSIFPFLALFFHLYLKSWLFFDQNKQKILVHWPVVMVTKQKIFHSFQLF